MRVNELEQERVWNLLYREVVSTLQSFGREDRFGNADYLVVDDNYGWKRITVEAHKLEMLRPEVIAALKELVSPFSGWSIAMAVDIPGMEGKWPSMGVIVRPHETVDGLSRGHLPPEWRSVSYPNSRPGVN
jgi:hypothetical protein